MEPELDWGKETVEEKKNETIAFMCICVAAQLVKNPPAYAGDLGSIPESGRSPGAGNSYPLQFSGLKNSMEYTVHGVTKSRT